MSVTSTVPPKNQYVAAGQTAFSFTFEIKAQTDIRVYVGTTLKTLATHYTLSGVGEDAGGTVTFLSAPASGAIVTLYRDMAYSRALDLHGGDSYKPDQFNAEFDRTWFGIQQAVALAQGAIRIAPYANTGETFEITEVADDRAGLVLGFDQDGNVTLSTLTLEEIEAGPLLADASATAAAASATAAAGSATSAAGSVTSATASAATATTQATNASTSATNAAASEANADTSEANAATSATAAAGSATAAATSATSASTSATTATTQATNSANSASAASTSATNAATSATSAAGSATAAATSATNAAGSATGAAGSATAAAGSASDAAASAVTAAGYHFGSMAAGTAGAAGLPVTGDVDTGLFQAAANTLSVTAGGVEQVRITQTATAVNRLELTGSTTGNAVQVAAAGSDGDIDIDLVPKGSGQVRINGGPTGWALFMTHEAF